jgi:hypothetical protein
VQAGCQKSQGQAVELRCVFRAQEAINELNLYGIRDDALGTLNKQHINFKYDNQLNAKEATTQKEETTSQRDTTFQRDTRPKS